MGQAKPLSVNNAEKQLIRHLLVRLFPNLATDIFEPESEDTDEYNCIAWAADDTDNWWWPGRRNLDYWPIQWRAVERDCFVAAFQTFNYEACGSNFALEAGFEKVAIYEDASGEPKHMARQLSSGIWTSKLGERWDIVHHTLEGIEGQQYGRAVLALRRPIRS